MDKILLAAIVFVAGMGIAFAQLYARGVTHKPNYANPFISHKKSNPTDSSSVYRGKQRQKMRPGRNFDNPAADQFGDGSPPNTYVPGRKKPFMPRDRNR